MPTPRLPASSPSSPSAPWSSIDFDDIDAVDAFGDNAPWFMRPRERSRVLWAVSTAIVVVGIVAGCFGHVVVMAAAATAILSPAVMLLSARQLARVAGASSAAMVLAVMLVSTRPWQNAGLILCASMLLLGSVMMLPATITSIARLMIHAHTPPWEQTSRWPVAIALGLLFVIGPAPLWILTNGNS